ncbi:retrovirus-related pol polyprotein from transposon TNT 1-94 [Tanacetum coccineum]
MRALLIQHGCKAALEVLPADMEAEVKAELNKKAHSAVILCLGNKILREVTGETTAAGVWSKLETLYMTKSLANKLCNLKQKLYTILYAESYEHFVDTLLYGREALTLEDVVGHTKLKESKKGTRRRVGDGERLYDTSKRMISPSSSGSTYDDSELGDNRECKTAVLDKGEGTTEIMGQSFVINMSVVYSGIEKKLVSLGTLEKSEINASVEEKDSLAQVWHTRLGHISEAWDYRCWEKARFGVGRHTTQGVVDYVHSDLWGPSQVESLGGKRFKHEAFGKFKEWKQLVENQPGRTVKKLRTDNGLEFFCNREFEQLYIESGIARHLTVVGTPQQNRVAERMNRTLIDKVPHLVTRVVGDPFLQVVSEHYERTCIYHGFGDGLILQQIFGPRILLARWGEGARSSYMILYSQQEVILPILFKSKVKAIRISMEIPAAFFEGDVKIDLIGFMGVALNIAIYLSESKLITRPTLTESESLKLVSVGCNLRKVLPKDLTTNLSLDDEILSSLRSMDDEMLPSPRETPSLAATKKFLLLKVDYQRL